MTFKRMEMEVIKAGIMDTFQDGGRHGYAHLGVGAGGCMDSLSGAIANLLVGNSKKTAVLEMHFPAPVLQFNQGCLIALSGADFGANVMGIALPVNRPVFLAEGSKLQFTQKAWGQRCYLAVEGGWKLKPVLGSCSTHLKAGFGGWEGRILKRGDKISLVHGRSKLHSPPEIGKWFVYPNSLYKPGPIRVMPGPEWHWLGYDAQKLLLNEPFTITQKSDRMGYQLKGPVVERIVKHELLSSGVLPGTIQLLPNGNPLLLMADCQTTGGYPRILQVAAVDLPKLAQMGAGEDCLFSMISRDEAVDFWEGLIRQMESLKGAIQLI